MRREYYTTCVTRPMFDIQRRIVHWHKRVTRVAENRFNEIQIADQRSWCEEAYFHRLLRTVSRYFRTDRRSQQHGDPEASLLFLGRCERQQQQIRRRIHRMPE